jgi:hypothetical protein
MLNRETPPCSRRTTPRRPRKERRMIGDIRALRTAAGIRVRVSFLDAVTSHATSV